MVAGLERKGAIAEGRDADLVLFEPDEALRGRPGRAPPPQPGHALRGAAARRTRLGHVRSRGGGLRGRAVPGRTRGPPAVEGRGVSDFTTLPDLAARRLGGMVLVANDEFFAPKENLLEPEAPVFDPDRYTDRGKEMDGWETRRRREPGHDWCIVRLGIPGIVRGVVVDTSFFRGNYPDRCSLEGAVVGGGRRHGGGVVRPAARSPRSRAMRATGSTSPRRSGSRTSGSTSSRTAGSRGSASTASRSRICERSPTPAAGPTSRRRCRAGSCSTRATCSSPRRTT